MPFWPRNQPAPTCARDEPRFALLPPIRSPFAAFAGPPLPLLHSARPIHHAGPLASVHQGRPFLPPAPPAPPPEWVCPAACHLSGAPGHCRRLPLRRHSEHSRNVERTHSKHSRNTENRQTIENADFEVNEYLNSAESPPQIAAGSSPHQAAPAAHPPRVFYYLHLSHS